MNPNWQKSTTNVSPNLHCRSVRKNFQHARARTAIAAFGTRWSETQKRRLSTYLNPDGIRHKILWLLLRGPLNSDSLPVQFHIAMFRKRLVAPPRCGRAKQEVGIF